MRPVIFLTAVVAGMLTLWQEAFAQGPVPAMYKSFDGPVYRRFAWEGKSVMFLTAQADLDYQTMSKLVDGAEKICNYYYRMTGQSPTHSDQSRAFRGRITIAAVPKTGDAACRGWPGGRGIEMKEDNFLILYKGMHEKGEFDQALAYEFGRNFWFYADQLKYPSGGDHEDSLGTAFAIFMRFKSMEAAGLKGGPFRAQPFSRFRKEVTKLLDTYCTKEDPETGKPLYDWNNTIRTGKAVPNQMGLSYSDLMASKLLYMESHYGGDEFVGYLWRAVALCPPARSTREAVANFEAACCVAAGEDLAPLFKFWRWPVSYSKKQANALCQNLRGARLKPASKTVAVAERE